MTKARSRGAGNAHRPEKQGRVQEVRLKPESLEVSISCRLPQSVMNGVLAGGKDLNLRPLGYEFCSPFLLLLVSSSLSNTYLLKPFGDSWCFLLVLVATGRNSGSPAATQLTACPALFFLSERTQASEVDLTDTKTRGPSAFLRRRALFLFRGAFRGKHIT